MCVYGAMYGPWRAGLAAINYNREREKRSHETWTCADRTCRCAFCAVKNKAKSFFFFIIYFSSAVHRTLGDSIYLQLSTHTSTFLYTVAKSFSTRQHLFCVFLLRSS